MRMTERVEHLSRDFVMGWFPRLDSVQSSRVDLVARHTNSASLHGLTHYSIHDASVCILELCSEDLRLICSQSRRPTARCVCPTEPVRRHRNDLERVHCTRDRYSAVSIRQAIGTRIYIIKTGRRWSKSVLSCCRKGHQPRKRSIWIQWMVKCDKERTDRFCT